MTEEDRQKLCADLCDPWRISMEGGEQALADLAGVAAETIEHQEKLIARYRNRADEGWTMAAKYAEEIDQLKNELAAAKGDPAPDSVTRWWTRPKRSKPVDREPYHDVIKPQPPLTRAEWVKHRIKHINDKIVELEAKQNGTESWGAAASARSEWLVELRSEASRLRQGREPTRHHAGLPPTFPYPAEDSDGAK